ncbi:hypothetical protein KKC22_13155, partial [Myxococcota bacterium]|nr:hypothetical protein [Myxococcota bacterium]
TLHDKSRFALEGDVRFGNDEDQKRCGQEYENERGRQAVLRYRNLKRAIEEDKRRQAERREREDRDAASARKEKEAEALRMAEMTRTAMSGGCRKGTEYIGCYRLGNYCASFSGYSSRNLTLSSVAEAAARLIYAENFPFRKRRSDVEGSARAILSKCDGLPVTNITDLCDSEGVRSSCVRKNRFNLDN